MHHNHASAPTLCVFRFFSLCLMQSELWDEARTWLDLGLNPFFVHWMRNTRTTNDQKPKTQDESES